jgi:hypothetical protein
MNVNKVLLTLSIMVLSGSLLAQENSSHSKSRARTDQRGARGPLVGGYLTVIRWTVNDPGGLPVHYGVAHYGTDPKI